MRSVCVGRTDGSPTQSNVGCTCAICRCVPRGPTYTTSPEPAVGPTVSASSKVSSTNLSVHLVMFSQAYVVAVGVCVVKGDMCGEGGTCVVKGE